MSEVSPINPQNELNSFLDYLYDGLTGYVYAPVKEDGVWTQWFFQWPSERSELTKHIITNAPLKDVYVAPAIFNKAEALKENVIGSQVVWTELDGSVPSEATTESAPRVTLRVQTSDVDHEHWYWKLDSFVTDIKRIEEINRSLCYLLGADAGSWDINQVLRPPGTVNHKREEKRAVRISYTSGSTYALTDFGNLSTPPQVVNSADFGTIPDVFDVVAKYPWSPGLTKFFKSKQEYPKRSSALLSLAYSCAEMGMSNAEIFSVIRNADDRWRKFYGRADRDRRLADMVNKARLKYPKIGTNILLNNLPVYGFQSFLATKIQIDWVIEGLVHKQGYFLLTGPGGIGKTQVSLRFAINICLGRDYLGFKIREPRKLIFFSLEMGHAELKLFIETMAQNLSEEDLKLLEENLLLIPIGESLYLNTTHGKDLMYSVLSEHRPAGFMFDSIGSSSDEDVSNANVVKDLMDLNDTVRKEFDCFSWFVHHNRKAQVHNKKPKTQDDIYGNQYLVNRATSIFTLWPDGENIEMSCIKLRLAKPIEPIILVRTSQLDFFKKVPVKITEPKNVNLGGSTPVGSLITNAGLIGGM